MVVNGESHGFSSPVTGWLLQQERLSNPGGVRWSPHPLPISPTYHSSLESCTSAKLHCCTCAQTDSKSLTHSLNATVVLSV